MTTKESGPIRIITFDDFFDEHFDRTRRILEVVLGDSALAEDSAQEAFIRAFRSWNEVSAMDRPAGWVLTVGLNRARDSFWGRRRDALHRSRPVPGGDLHVDSERDIDLVSRLRALPMRQRQAVVLRYLVDLSLEEVAAHMDCALGTVKSTLNAALTNLRVNTEEKK